MHVEHIYRINDTAGDFDELFRLWDRLTTGCTDVCFDLTWCKFLRQNAVAFLGGLARLVEYRGGKVSFNWDIRDSAVAMNLAQNGFKAAFRAGGHPWAGNSIPYREDTRQDAHGFQHYLSELWLGRGWVKVSAPLRTGSSGTWLRST
jgi:hypothetical protein